MIALQPRRLAGGTAVALLHLVVIVLLLHATQRHVQPAPSVKEIILRLVAQPQMRGPPMHKSGKSEERSARPRRILPAENPHGSSFKSFEKVPAMPSSGLSQQLFGCSPDQLATATAEQRARCASLGPQYDAGATDYRDHTDRSKSAALWFRDRARKNAPLLLPCMSPAGWSPLYTAYCLAKSAVTRKLDPEEQPGYQDMPDHAVNEGDTRLAPTPH